MCRSLHGSFSVVLANPAGRDAFGPDAHELPASSQGHLTGNWGGVRTRLLERGVKFDFHYVNDTLGNINGPRNTRLDSLGRMRGTIDIDFGKLIDQQGLSFHATAVLQNGGNLGQYLGLTANPSALASMNTFRLDSWWFEKRWLNEHLAVRAGQFAGQDSYGHQNFGKAFIFEPLNAALDNLFSTTYVSFDPPSTPAFELRVVPIHSFYVKSMVLSQDRMPFANNTTGLVPRFHGAPVSVSEIGFTPGKKAIARVPADNVGSREGYSGLYQFGASYNPGSSLSAGPGNQSLGIIFCTGLRIRRYGARIRSNHAVWMRLLRMIGVPRT